ncbi:hypothetical protein IFDJLNFL_2485 [Methylobacterium dankookense]|uniref:Uncharacterized protein n=1 Tax=Methylobacterium dankookense TaxID=560405 RepID=A0ABQ4RFR6_9HYPH|nr:hypothetical protein IFDJLNFL_2485 [Methylobacterium dankookense]
MVAVMAESGRETPRPTRQASRPPMTRATAPMATTRTRSRPAFSVIEVMIWRCSPTAASRMALPMPTRESPICFRFWSAAAKAPAPLRTPSSAVFSGPSLAFATLSEAWSTPSPSSRASAASSRP